MPARQAICIVVDGLRASALGCYGNMWVPTPALDRLASRSIVADWMWCDSPRLADFYYAVWRGKSAWSKPTSSAAPLQPLPGLLSGAGVGLSCVTDEPDLPQVAPEFVEFDTVQVHAPEKRARLASETGVSALFEAAVQLIAEATETTSNAGDEARLTWIHTRGMRGPWDAPLEVQAKLLEEDELEPLEAVQPPEYVATDDPDDVLGYRAAYAAQTAMLDMAVEGLVAVLGDWGVVDETLIVLTGARGFPLGEHGIVGSRCDQLYSELLHVPFMASTPDMAFPRRISRLLQPFDLYRLLRHWFLDDVNRTVSGSKAAAGGRVLAALRCRDLAVARNGRGEASVRTPAWQLLRRAPRDDVASVDAPTTGGCELFVKPDDRWEANEIADLRMEVTDQLTSLLASVRVWPPGDETPLELDPVLLEPER